MVIDTHIFENKEKNLNKVTDNVIKDNILQKNDLKSSRGRGSISKQTGNSSNATRLPSNYPRPGESPRGNDGHLFTVETVRDSFASAIGGPERPLRSPEPMNNRANNASSSRMPPTPNMNEGNLSTPSISTINTSDTPRFETLPNTVYTLNENSSVANPRANNNTYNPVNNYTPVSRTQNINYPTTNPSQGVYIPTNNNSTSVHNNETYYGHAYPVPGQVPYFNSYNVSASRQVTIGSNTSNERYDLNSQDAPGPANWNDSNRYKNVGHEYLWRNTYHSMSDVDMSVQRKAVIRNYNANIEDKEVYSPPMDNEIVINKKGLLGRLKLAFSYGNNNLNKDTNVNSIFVKYRDITKRKFVWKLWEKDSGNYESYQDFKESWNPDTSIWNEIKQRTKRDMQADVEGMLGIPKKVRRLDYTTKKSLGVSKVRTEVDNLVRSKQPFGVPIIENGEQSNEGNASSRPKHSSNRKYSTDKHNHKHSHSHSDGHNHKRSHSHSDGHKHKRSHSHSHSHTHHHSSHHKHSSHNNQSSHGNRQHGRSSSSDRYYPRSSSRDPYV
jgi:hypothetical protein